MKRLYCILLSIFFFAHVSYSKIVEHDRIESILDYLAPEDLTRNTIVLLDIDNTIAEPHKIGDIILESSLGSEQWVTYHIIKALQQTGISDYDAKQTILPLFFELQHIIDLKPVEPITVSLIHQLQKMGVIVIGLTARSLPIVDRTIAQLNALGIDFTQNQLAHVEIISTDNLIYHYKNGIIFCNGNDKGKVLHDLLSHLNIWPAKYICVDDKEKHLHAVQKILNPDHSYVGIRYSYLDAKAAQFDPLHAQQELLLLTSQGLYESIH